MNTKALVIVFATIAALCGRAQLATNAVTKAGEPVGQLAPMLRSTNGARMVGLPASVFGAGVSNLFGAMTNLSGRLSVVESASAPSLESLTNAVRDLTNIVRAVSNSVNELSASVATATNAAGAFDAVRFPVNTNGLTVTAAASPAVVGAYEWDPVDERWEKDGVYAIAPVVGWSNPEFGFKIYHQYTATIYAQQNDIPYASPSPALPYTSPTATASFAVFTASVVAVREVFLADNVVPVWNSDSGTWTAKVYASVGPWYGDFNPTNEYATGTMVVSEGFIYVCISALGFGDHPAPHADTDHWRLFAPAGTLFASRDEGGTYVTLAGHYLRGADSGGSFYVQSRNGDLRLQAIGDGEASMRGGNQGGGEGLGGYIVAQKASIDNAGGVVIETGDGGTAGADINVSAYRIGDGGGFVNLNAYRIYENTATSIATSCLSHPSGGDEQTETLNQWVYFVGPDGSGGIQTNRVLVINGRWTTLEAPAP